MSYDLSPRNKKVKEIRVGAFSWPIIMQETGMGYVVGYGSGRDKVSYVYRPDNRGASPASNDGYRITSFEAKAMAAVGRGFVSVQRFINKEWESLSETERLSSENAKNHKGEPLYRSKWAEEMLVQIEEICDFFEKSNGFSIN